VSETARTLLDTEGESARFEFKRRVDAASPTVLVAAANWVALEPGNRDKVTLLVGVDEDPDDATGLVKGKIVGLKDLERAATTIQNYARETKPVPVDLTIIEEGVATTTPFLRLEIRPTSPPHYDAEGRRVTRYNKSTRALTDEELLDIYLDREAAKFEQRFRRTASDLLASLRDVAATVEDMSVNLDDRVTRLHGAAWEAADEAQQSKSVAERLEDDMRRLQSQVEGLDDHSPVGLFFLLRNKRVFVWSAFSEDAAFRPTKATDRLVARLKTQLERPIDPNAWLTNLAELQFWNEVLKRRGDRGTMTGWAREIAAREKLKIPTTIPLQDEIGRLRKLSEGVREAKPRRTDRR
jgi:hypothetical protein